MTILFSGVVSESSLSKSLKENPSEEELSFVLILLFAQIFLIIFIGFAWALEVLRYSGDVVPAEKLENMKHMTSKTNAGSFSPTFKSNPKPKQNEFTI